TILMVIGAGKAFMAGAGALGSSPIFSAGAGALFLGIVAPSRLFRGNRLLVKKGAAIAKMVNPTILALLFFFVVAPTALVMRMAGRRPLRLAPDRAGESYWIRHESADGGPSNMKRQF